LVIKSDNELITKIDNNKFPICIENLADLLEIEPKSLLKINKCNHIFHINCIYPLFNKHNRKIDCPLYCQIINIINNVY